MKPVILMYFLLALVAYGFAGNHDHQDRETDEYIEQVRAAVEKDTLRVDYD